MNFFKIKHVLIGIILLMLISCSLGNKKADKPYTQEEKDILLNFAKVLKDSFNHYDFELLRASWDADIFKNRVRPLDQAEQTAFNIAYPTQISKMVVNSNVDIINKLKFSGGKIILTRVVFFPNHVEATYSMLCNGMVDFFRYRMELSGGKPKLTDYYSLKDGKWQSINIVDLMVLNSSFNNTQKRGLTLCIDESERALKVGDTLAAIDWLGRMPPLPGSPSSYSIKRIQLAYNMTDSVFFDVLESERSRCDNMYIKYLYGYYSCDTVLIDEIVNYLRTETGKDNHVVDSLALMTHFWN